MRSILHPKLIVGRIRTGDYGSDDSWGCTGAFQIMGPNGMSLRIIASDASGDVRDICEGWEHVSVSTVSRCPNWPEMCFVKDLFWTDEEVVVQFHPPRSNYVNNHPHCLHMFRDTRNGHALPPSILVGVASAGTLETEAHADKLRREVREQLGD